jgi:hypothetical protein
VFVHITPEDHESRIADFYRFPDVIEYARAKLQEILLKIYRT